MKRTLNFVGITAADFIVRSAYQMGKTPLLPTFAAALGAADMFLGFIVSVSTLTGMVLKPVIGMLSDRWGRRWWLIVGTGFFAGMPFLYRFIHTPEGLFGIRIVHGLATAIYGPVTLAFVVEQGPKRRAEKLGWFSLARNAGYIVGPAVAGWLLLTMQPVRVFTIIGLLSCLAFIPILLLSEPAPPIKTARPPLRWQIAHALKSGTRTPSVWLSGGLESTVFIGLYAAKAFLPIYAGVSVAVVGAFFAIQEGAHMVLRPIGGRAGDRLGYFRAICGGMVLIGLALLFITWAHGTFGLMALAILIGAGQALVFPSTVALASTQIDEHHIGAGMGLIGTLKNAGKVAGPILGGVLIHWLDFSLMFRFMGLLLLLGAGMVWYWGKRGQDRIRLSDQKL
ncbi:MAG: MFS transporter [Candidatus Poribacteria bacterium]|nr:MFS transporter [Candidatus Poribacteria bacterium]